MEVHFFAWGYTSLSSPGLGSVYFYCFLFSSFVFLQFCIDILSLYLSTTIFTISDHSVIAPIPVRDKAGLVKPCVFLFRTEKPHTNISASQRFAHRAMNLITKFLDRRQLFCGQWMRVHMGVHRRKHQYGHEGRKGSKKGGLRKGSDPNLAV